FAVVPVHRYRLPTERTSKRLPASNPTAERRIVVSGLVYDDSQVNTDSICICLCTGSAQSITAVVVRHAPSEGVSPHPLANLSHQVRQRRQRRELTGSKCVTPSRHSVHRKPVNVVAGRWNPEF